MEMVKNSEVTYGKFNVVGICSDSSYALKWITKLYNYFFIVFLALSYKFKDIKVSKRH
jgi:hypothetical protein